MLFRARSLQYYVDHIVALLMMLIN